LSSPGRPEIIAIPVFVSRVFRHSAIYVAESSKIKTPKDLEGKRVGIPEWAQTAGIYVRGLLQHEYGVDLASIDWRQAAVPQPGATIDESVVRAYLRERLATYKVPRRVFAFERKQLGFTGTQKVQLEALRTLVVERLTAERAEVAGHVYEPQ